jgi:ABC-type Fe3+-siderophore transport system permease subunit
MIVGGMAVLLLDNIALLGNPIIPLGVFTGFIGVPFYLMLLMDRRRQL